MASKKKKIDSFEETRIMNSLNNRPVVPAALKYIVSTLVIILGVLITATWLWETNNAGYTVICQAPFSGNLQVVTSPGAFWQGGGTITIYKQIATISFGTETEDVSTSTGTIPVRFNDSGIANVSCTVRFELPSDEEHMRLIHTQYRSYDHLCDTLLKKVTAETLVLTASMFSSEDTYGGGKAEYVRLAQDQLENGKYQTDVSEVETEDPVTNDKRRVKKVSIRRDTNGNAMRLENPLVKFGIKANPPILDKDFDYEPGIKNQIEKQREAFLQTVSAKAIAMKASQEAITAEAEGKAKVMTTKYEMLVEKERATVEAGKNAEVAKIQADNRLLVAQLDRQAAEETKKKEILLGEGEASRRAAVMAADGALEMKLKTLLEISKVNAEAISNYRGNWVPQVMMGSSNGQSANGVNDLIQLLTSQAAKNLAIDLSVNQNALQK